MRPGTAARAATGTVRFEDVAWLRPFSLDEARSGGAARLHIALVPEPRAVSSGETRMRYECYGDPEGGEEGLLAQGHAVVRPATDPPVLDLEALRSRCAQRFSAEQCYRAFASGGLDYGPSFRGIDTLFVGADLALARLSLQPSVADPRFVLHPSLMDAALQACLGLVAVADEPDGSRAGVSLPFALDALEIFGACAPAMWAVVRFSPGTGPCASSISTCATRPARSCPHAGLFHESRRSQPAAHAGLSIGGALMLTPVWDVVALDRTQPVFPAADDRTLIVAPAGETAIGKALRQRYPAAESLTLDDGVAINTIAAWLQALGAVDHLFWLAPPPRGRRGESAGVARAGQVAPPLIQGEGQGNGYGGAGTCDGATPGDDALVDGRERRMFQVFRLVKALLRTGYGDRTFALTALATLSLPVCHGDGTDPTHAGVHGLIGWLAKKIPPLAHPLPGPGQPAQRGRRRARGG